MNTDDRLYANLSKLVIAYYVTEHDAVFTVEQSQKVNDALPGAHTNNLFLKDAGRQFWLVTVPAKDRVNVKALPAAIGSKKVSFGKAEGREHLLGVTPGSVTPLATALALSKTINVHPLRNIATITLSSNDLIRALEHWNHKPLFAPVSVLETL
jgi:Ala-tRNA(Pro) deacylase